MKKRNLLFLLLMVTLLPLISINAQDIEVIREDSVIYGNPGDLLVLYTKIKNISSVDQVVFMVRTENNLPNNWTSSLCFSDVCLSPIVDSVATTPDFGLDPVPPGDTIEASVHFTTDPTTPGTGHVQIQIGTANSPNIRTTINETASTEPEGVEDQANAPAEFKLMQNYPNPFNPSTTISFTVPQRSDVSLRVYNITGKEIATLVNGEREPGNYRINFDGQNYSSGIYFYKFTAGKFSSVRKMILLK